MLDNDAFVFDCVCHVFNFDMRNAYGKPGQMFINHLYAFHQVLTPPNERVLKPEEFLREWGIDEIAHMVFDESGTDMIVAQPLPLTDLFHDGLSQWEKCAAMAQKYPDRAVFWGTVNPLEGKKALDLMERLPTSLTSTSSSSTSACPSSMRFAGNWYVIPTSMLLSRPP